MSAVKLTKAALYYFGCIHDAGHYLWPAPDAPKMRTDGSPWGFGIDGQLTPKNTRKQGISELHHKDGWTALSFWDCSVDGRGGSNSTFLVNETLDAKEMLALAQSAFPKVFARFSFDVVLPAAQAQAGRTALAQGQDNG